MEPSRPRTAGRPHTPGRIDLVGLGAHAIVANVLDDAAAFIASTTAPAASSSTDATADLVPMNFYLPVYDASAARFVAAAGPPLYATPAVREAVEGIMELIGVVCDLAVVNEIPDLEWSMSWLRRSYAHVLAAMFDLAQWGTLEIATAQCVKVACGPLVEQLCQVGGPEPIRIKLMALRIPAAEVLVLFTATGLPLHELTTPRVQARHRARLATAWGGRPWQTDANVWSRICHAKAKLFDNAPRSRRPQPKRGAPPGLTRPPPGMMLAALAAPTADTTPPWHAEGQAPSPPLDE